MAYSSVVGIYKLSYYSLKRLICTYIYWEGPHKLLDFTWSRFWRLLPPLSYSSLPFLYIFRPQLLGTGSASLPHLLGSHTSPCINNSMSERTLGRRRDSFTTVYQTCQKQLLVYMLRSGSKLCHYKYCPISFDTDRMAAQYWYWPVSIIPRAGGGCLNTPMRFLWIT